MLVSMHRFHATARLYITFVRRRVSGEVAPEKAERSLLFLMTIIRELGFALARTDGEGLLEASVLEAALQVLFSLQQYARYYSLAYLQHALCSAESCRADLYLSNPVGESIAG